MMRRFLLVALVVFSLFILYVLFWPVSIAPVAWTAPPDPGYTGVFAVNERLKGIETFSIGDNFGPEDIALDASGRIYAATHHGFIVRLQPDGSHYENWADTKGRPLGIDFDGNGNLIVADAFRGLLSINPSGDVTLLTDRADGIPIRYADDVDVAADGRIYFSDASVKFGAKACGGTYEASLLDINEHGGHGRLLVFDPADGTTRTLLDGLHFANGVAVGHDQRYVLVNETGLYRVVRYWLAGPQKGQTDLFIEALPGFPDNLSTGLDGRYWVALVSPRSKLLDRFAGNPFLRRMMQRFPSFVRPKAKPYGHIIALNRAGEVVQDLQDPDAAYPINTSVTETRDYLYIGSLFTPVLGRLPKAAAGL